MKVHLRYFASIRETLGTGTETLETAAPTLGALREELVARGGAHAQALARGRAVRMALNQVMSDESAALTEGAEVGVFPPVTGG
ncbi:MoaD/ThiS family protein [Hydrogenophaga sp.]|uniref:MoaD/ThiS family protein n=1 Tax=Hydrogenophaga sp. TaxID=1904254 RepID=UPI00261827FE|nr:MoaD/ThiS family protein [Hydrogenophaga sp.]MCW5652692.1 MoaD/ThiS family protein [Hydrogenophaga sp.]